MCFTFEPQVLRPSDVARRAEERLQQHVIRRLDDALRNILLGPADTATNIAK